MAAAPAMGEFRSSSFWLLRADVQIVTEADARTVESSDPSLKGDNPPASYASKQPSGQGGGGICAGSGRLRSSDFGEF